MPEKPDSKRGRVRTAFREAGEDKALAVGQELGVTPARLKRWFKMWSDGSSTPQRGEPITVKAKSGPATGPRVFLFGNVARTGTVLKHGPEQSLIRWDNGNEVVASNDWFEPLPAEQDRKRRIR